MLLEITGLCKSFGGLRALANINLSVEEGEIIGLIGPNGAGKSTLFNVITGTFMPSSGKVVFMGKDISREKPHNITRMGIGRVYQANVAFGEETVLGQLLLGCHTAYATGVLGSFLGTSASRQEEKEMREKSIATLELLGLAHVQNELASSLPHGYQRAISIATVLVSEPRLLLLDEPITGMNEEERKEMLGKIANINSNGTTIIMIEHDMKAIMSLCKRIAVLNYGAKIAEGTPQEVAHNQNVIDAYLGESDEQ